MTLNPADKVSLNNCAICGQIKEGVLIAPIKPDEFFCVCNQCRKLIVGI